LEESVKKMPPKPPHLRKHPPHGPLPLPPHLMHAKENKGVLLKSFLAGSALTLVVGAVLLAAKVESNVVLPVIAPVWVGSITLLYNHWKTH
jgi:hypothetical protein